MGSPPSLGTTEGCNSYDFVDWFFPGNTGQNKRYDYDTQRQKYVNLSTNIQEYMVERLEGGEWFNYTRTFADTNYYNVYLRYGSMYTMQLRLDRVTPGPTLSKLGEFYTTNALGRSNFRYAPLMTLVSTWLSGARAWSSSSHGSTPG